MRHIIFYLLAIIILLPSCQKEEKKSKEQKIVKSFKTEKTGKDEAKEEKKGSGIFKKIFKDKDYDDEFFEKGFKTIKGKKYGVYKVVPGDSVWKIAEKFCKDYLRKDDYTKTDIGNVHYSINLVNYNKLFGGVNDNLVVGKTILIPLHYEEYVEEYFRRIRYIKGTK